MEIFVHCYCSLSKNFLQYFLKTGTCKYGSTCKFHHPRDRRGAGPVSFNILGFPMRQVIYVPFYHYSTANYMRTDNCINLFSFLSDKLKSILPRKKSHVLITWELDHASSELHASLIIPSLLLLEPCFLLPLLLLDQRDQCCLLQIYLMQVGFRHGLSQECPMYLVRNHNNNLMCLLLFLLLKALYPQEAGTPTWSVYQLFKSNKILRICH